MTSGGRPEMGFLNKRTLLGRFTVTHRPWRVQYGGLIGSYLS